MQNFAYIEQLSPFVPEISQSLYLLDIYKM